MHKVTDDLYFVIEEKLNSVDLTDKGIDLITSSSDDADFFIMPDIGAEVAELENSNLNQKQILEKKDNLIHSLTADGFCFLNSCALWWLPSVYSLFTDSSGKGSQCSTILMPGISTCLGRSPRPTLRPRIPRILPSSGGAVSWDIKILKKLEKTKR